jgi:hypothetical protein
MSQCQGFSRDGFRNGVGVVESSQLIATPITLARFRGRLIITHWGDFGESSLTLSPEQEVEFWKQAAGVIGEEAAYHCLKEAEIRAIRK